MTSSLRSFITPQRLRRLTRRGQDLISLPPWTSKLIYSSYIEQKLPIPGHRLRLKDKHRERRADFRAHVSAHRNSNIPVALKYTQAGLSNLGLVTDEEEDWMAPELGLAQLQYPYRIVTQEQQAQTTAEPQEEETDESFLDSGTPNPNIPPSNVPCGGCGAFLHCQNTSIPGYVPSERMSRLSGTELCREVCHRCYVLSNHNAALRVNVSPEDYPRILSEIRDKYALVVLMVDLLDFPCSLWPGIMDIIGTKRPVILVGNKVDLLPRDSRNYLRHLTQALESTARETGLRDANLVHTTLISATTGYGVEGLITKLFNIWGFKGDIYLMGCTNVGKSSLFNVFLQSDFCKVQVHDLVQRATISPWPGTTLNLLKFPVTRPEGWRLAVRATRLREESVALAAREKLRLQELRETRDPAHATLQGHVGRTFVDPEKVDKGEEFNSQIQDLFHVNAHSKSPGRVSPGVGDWNPHDSNFLLGKWCFDTPGAVAENQILDQLVLGELVKSLPREMIQPRTYLMRTGLSLFVGGLARVDYVEGPRPIRLTVCSSNHLPVTITKTEEADEVYNEGLGSPILGVPFGSEERLREFPALKGRRFKLTGVDYAYSCADLVISSAGWIGVSAGPDQEIHLEVHTPNGKGLFCRVPSFLPELVRLKGGRIRGSLAYTPSRAYIPPN